ncbi:MAG: Acg family FMN-binding oxidoreductase [Pararhodobacter sp.]
MSLSRRKMLALIGGGTVLAAGAAGTGFALTRTPARALAPWAEAGGYDDPRLNALSFAILAPNPHNRQPWEAELVADDRVRIFRDPALNLPHTDPYDRQMTIGMGCFAEQMAIAATATGHFADLAFFPDGDRPGAPVAEAVFVPGAAQPDPLGAALLDRRSCKEPYTDQQVGAPAIASLEAFARLITGPGEVAAIRDLTWAAHMVEVMTPRTYGESVDLMRFGRREIDASPDGIDLGGPFLESLMLVGALTRDGQRDPDSAEFRQGIEIYRRMLHATPAYAVVTTQGNSRQDQIDAGRRYLRLNLATTTLGLALHPVSQALQEYPEMADHYATAHRLLAGPGETVQMLGRLGYGPAVSQTPRWPLDAKLRRT